MHAHRYKSACTLTVTLVFNPRSLTVSSIRRAIWRETITLSLGSLNCRIIELQYNIRWSSGARYSSLGVRLLFFFHIKRWRAAFETRGPTREARRMRAAFTRCARRSSLGRRRQLPAGPPADYTPRWRGPREQLIPFGVFNDEVSMLQALCRFQRNFIARALLQTNEPSRRAKGVDLRLV